MSDSSQLNKSNKSVKADNKSRAGIWFVEAAKSGDLNLVKKIFKQEGKKILPYRGELKQTAFHAAAYQGHQEVIQFLIKKSGDTYLHEQDKNGWSPLQCAASAGHLSVCELLIKAGGLNVSMGGVTTPLHYVVRHRWVPGMTGSVIGSMLKKGININVLNEQKETPLFQSCMKGQAKVARFLLENGAQLNARNDAGETPLHFACRAGKVDVVQLLLEYGAMVDDSGKHGSPISVASAFEQKKVILRLKERELCDKLLSSSFIAKSGKMLWRDGKRWRSVDATLSYRSLDLFIDNKIETSVFLRDIVTIKLSPSDHTRPFCFELVCGINEVSKRFACETLRDLCLWMVDIASVKSGVFETCLTSAKMDTHSIQLLGEFQRTAAEQTLGSSSSVSRSASPGQLTPIALSHSPLLSALLEVAFAPIVEDGVAELRAAYGDLGEEWHYNANSGELLCASAHVPRTIVYRWDGQYLRSNRGSNCLGLFRFNGLLLQFFAPHEIGTPSKHLKRAGTPVTPERVVSQLDVDLNSLEEREATASYIWDAKQRSFHCDRETAKWKWSKNFLARINEQGETQAWTASALFPEPVALCVQIWREWRIQRSAILRQRFALNNSLNTLNNDSNSNSDPKQGSSSLANSNSNSEDADRARANQRRKLFQIDLKKTSNGMRVTSGRSFASSGSFTSKKDSNSDSQGNLNSSGKSVRLSQLTPRSRSQLIQREAMNRRRSSAEMFGPPKNNRRLRRTQTTMESESFSNERPLGGATFISRRFSTGRRRQMSGGAQSQDMSSSIDDASTLDDCEQSALSSV